MMQKKKIAVLYIDTRDNQRIILKLHLDGKTDEINKTVTSWTSQLLLPLIDGLLKKSNISVFQLSEVKAELGPGSFTGLRVGVAVANALGWLLDIPVNGRMDKLVEPVY